MPDTEELQRAFGQPGGQQKGCGFPVAHLLTLFDFSTGFLLKICAAPMRTHDMSQAERMHDEMRSGDVLVAATLGEQLQGLGRLVHREGLDGDRQPTGRQRLDQLDRQFAGPRLAPDHVDRQQRDIIE